MLGTIVNVAAISAGTIVGLLFKKGIPTKAQETIMQGLGLSVLLIGLKTAWQTQNVIILIISIAVGALIGECLGIEDQLEKLGLWLEKKVGNKGGNIAKAFVTSSLMYCIGAMAIMGSIEDGLTGKPEILLAKSTLDGISAIIFTSTLGIGVIFSTVPVLIYQGSITLMAGLIKEILTNNMITEMNATGGLLIAAIGTNILGLKRIKVGNLLPAILLAIVFTAIKNYFFR